ncbi:putative magnesium transporter MRS2-G [Carex littledalei]|uniref:Magnesium transporter n=1 Tax=Carex littledalei TaxID=544730 RepID=A0A833Q8I1_9POAL|nr:putative magnesium transporter MRS2-G [Carex littledalei]
MGKRSGKKPIASLLRKLRPSKRSDSSPLQTSGRPSPINSSTEATTAAVLGAGAKNIKKKTGPRLWMRFDRTGQSEILECDKSVIIRRAGIPARDLRILGPVFSQSSNILAREKAIVVNLEHIRAIVTAEEILILDPLCQEVLPFIDQLRQHVPLKTTTRADDGENQETEVPSQAERELPFEFQVLEVTLEVVCSSLGSSVTDLEREAYPVLDELARNVSTKNLERVRSLKSILTRLFARIQKVRDEIEHLLDDNEDMSDLYLTRKQIQNQQLDALMAGGTSNGIVPAGANMGRLNSNRYQRSISIATSMYSDNDVEDLEMLLEAYFMQLDGIRNRILSVREYIDDTEDYVNIQLDNQRNELIQLQLILTMASCAIALSMLICGAFSMNIQSSLYNTTNVFGPFIGGTLSGCFVIFLIMLAYARWNKLLDP